MCGIVGLLVKKPSMRDQHGALMVPMLVGMTERGPDAAGLAVYTAPVAEFQHKFSLYSAEHAVDWDALQSALTSAIPFAHEMEVIGNHAVLISPADPDAIVVWLVAHAP